MLGAPLERSYAGPWLLVLRTHYRYDGEAPQTLSLSVNFQLDRLEGVIAGRQGESAFGTPVAGEALQGQQITRPVTLDRSHSVPQRIGRDSPKSAALIR